MSAGKGVEAVSDAMLSPAAIDVPAVQAALRADGLDGWLRQLLQGLRRVAMEYSPKCAIPYVSRVDAGTIELVRAAGVEVVSSGDLIQRFASAWDERAIATHEEAAEKLYRVKDRAFEAIARRTQTQVPS